MVMATNKRLCCACQQIPPVLYCRSFNPTDSDLYTLTHLCRAVSEGADVVAEVVEGARLAVPITRRRWVLPLLIYKICRGRLPLCIQCVAVSYS